MHSRAPRDYRETGGHEQRHRKDHSSHRFFASNDFDYVAKTILGHAAQGSIDIGLVLATLNKIADFDAVGWFRAWYATAEALRTQALASRVTGVLTSARAFWPVRRCCRRRRRDGRGEGMASQSARSDAGPAEGGRRHQVDALLSAPKDPTVARTLTFRAKPYGKTSPFDLLTEVNRYTLYDVVDKITTPMLITDPEDEQFFPGQSCRALRRPDRPEGAGPVHGRAGIQRPLRADGATARRPADGRFLRRPARQGR